MLQPPSSLYALCYALSHMYEKFRLNFLKNRDINAKTDRLYKSQMCIMLF